MKQGRNTTPEERVQIVKDCLASGKNYGEIALKYKVSYQQVRTWTLRFEGDGRGRPGGPARKTEEGPGAQNRAGASTDRDRATQAQAVSGGSGA